MGETHGLETQPALARRAGMAHSQISRILRCEIGTGIDVLEAIAEALGREPWELLMDTEETRRRAIERALARTPVPDSRVEEHLPLPPSKVVAMRRRSKGE